MIALSFNASLDDDIAEALFKTGSTIGEWMDEVEPTHWDTLLAAIVAKYANSYQESLEDWPDDGQLHVLSVLRAFLHVVVDDAVDAVAAGQPYHSVGELFVNGGPEPTPLWDVLARLCCLAGTPGHSVSRRPA